MQSYRNIFLATLLGLSVTSCKRNPLELEPLSSFTAKADSMSVANDSAYYQLGSITTFNFTGNPATVTFYSGEVGKRYNNRSRTSANGRPLLIFTHALNSGTQDSTLRVMLSSDFKGNVPGDSAATANNIAAANWSDITPAKIRNKTASAIDTIDLSSFATAGKKVVVAFKYSAVAASVQNRWTITNLALNNYLPDNTQYTIANLNAANSPLTNYGVTDFSPGWVGQNIINTYKWAITTSGTPSLIIAGAGTIAEAVSNTEAWVVLGAVDLTKVTPDIGVPIKDIVAKPGLPYTYRYPVKGRFDAFFEAGNGSIYDSGTIARKIPIVIN
jgi:hypothetical protein